MPKILAIDYGQKRIGLALSDDEQRLAFGYATINQQAGKSQGCQDILAKIKDICQKEEVGLIIVGIPWGLGGEETAMSRQVNKFAAKLKKKLTVPVEMLDERLSSLQAEKFYPNKHTPKKIGGRQPRQVKKGRRRIDELSAQILLQSWLDR